MFDACPYQGMRYSGHVACRMEIIKANVASVGKYEERDNFRDLDLDDKLELHSIFVLLYYTVILMVCV
jgi:hypothetical protein